MEDDKTEKETINLSEEEIRTLTKGSLEQENKAKERRDAAYYRFFSNVLIVSSTVFTVAATLSLSHLQQVSHHPYYILSSRTFLILSLALFAGAILFSLIALCEQITLELNIIRRTWGYTREPEKYMYIIRSQGKKTVFVGKNPVKPRKIFFVSFWALSLCFVLGIFSLLVSVVIA